MKVGGFASLRAAEVIKIERAANITRWFKYDRDKLWLVYTQIVPVIFEQPCITCGMKERVRGDRFRGSCQTLCLALDGTK